MRSIERVFRKVREDNPFWSDLICFNVAVKNRKFGKQAIAEHFNRLVDKEDYDKKDKKVILRQAWELSQFGKMLDEEQRAKLGFYEK